MFTPHQSIPRAVIFRGEGIEAIFPRIPLEFSKKFKLVSYFNLLTINVGFTISIPYQLLSLCLTQNHNTASPSLSGSRVGNVWMSH